MNKCADYADTSALTIDNCDYNEADISLIVNDRFKCTNDAGIKVNDRALKMQEYILRDWGICMLHQGPFTLG